jgi:hypothetical protein
VVFVLRALPAACFPLAQTSLPPRSGRQQHDPRAHRLQHERITRSSDLPQPLRHGLCAPGEPHFLLCLQARVSVVCVLSCFCGPCPLFVERAAFLAPAPLTPTVSFATPVQVTGNAAFNIEIHNHPLPLSATEQVRAVLPWVFILFVGCLVDFVAVLFVLARFRGCFRNVQANVFSILVIAAKEDADGRSRLRDRHRAGLLLHPRKVTVLLVWVILA